MRYALALILFVAISTAVYADNHTTSQPPADPCADVTCSSPPAAACDGSNVKTYSGGTCSNGQCSYSSSTSTCRFGCSLGQCKPCESSACGANSKTCPDGFTATCQQTCSGNDCASCEPSCAGHETAPSTGSGSTGTSSNATGGGGSSSSDPCTNVVCNSPPPTSCSGNNIRFFSSPGACSNGQCSYPETGYACPNGCSNGACNPAGNGSSGSTSTGTGGTSGSVTCTDTDGGKNYFVKGTVEHRWPDQAPQIQTDGCSSSTGLVEKYCAPDGGRTEYYNCPGECRDGACVERTSGTGTGSACGNNICEPGEADRGGCPPGSPPECLGPPIESGTCPRDCRQSGTSNCPLGCDCRFGEHGELISQYCQSERRCNYNNVCDKDEDQSCKDCIGADCPTNRPCPDGSSVSCQRTERGCDCQPCKLQDVPQGCRQETDDHGFIRVVCERQGECPPVPQDVRIKCADEGGTPRFNKDNRGCSVFQCDFGGEKGSGPVFAGRANCPSPEAVIESLEKCRDLGVPGVIGFEGGCKIGKCQQQREENPCRPVERHEIDACRSSGGIPRAVFDGKGCKMMKCEQRNEQGEHRCEKDLPKEAYDRCGEEGGQLVVRRGPDGCVSYSNCIRRGNAEESFVEDINEIPDSTELLSIAFKLEDLKLEFDKLSKKTHDIAEYYKSTGSSEEKRFRRVSDMFSNAKDKVDEVKTKLKDRASDIGKDDVLEIKQDLRYLKDVVLKDILFVMLGSGEEIEEIKSGSTKNCGTDESCFDRAFRVCQPLTFRPEGREGPVVEVTGLEGDACVMVVKMEAGQGPPGGPYSMTCKIQKYSLGVSDPEKDIFPYCSGNLLDMIKKYGTEGGAPGVPGKCSGEECKDYCGRGAQEAKECLEYMGDVLPPEAKEHLTALAEGRNPSRGGGFFGGGDEDDFREGPGDFRDEGRDFGNEGEFRDEFSNEGDFGGGGEFSQGGRCPDRFCDDFERRTGACPQDCGGQSGGGQGEFRDEFGGGFESSSSGGGGGSGSCSGCLNNGVCDQGECSDCSDCRRR